MAVSIQIINTNYEGESSNPSRKSVEHGHVNAVRARVAEGPLSYATWVHVLTAKKGPKSVALFSQVRRCWYAAVSMQDFAGAVDITVESEPPHMMHDGC